MWPYTMRTCTALSPKILEDHTLYWLFFAILCSIRTCSLEVVKINLSSLLKLWVRSTTCFQLRSALRYQEPVLCEPYAQIYAM